MASIIGDDQQVQATVVFVDRRGHPAQVDGVPTWDTSDAALLSVTPSSDGMSALIAAVGPLGSGQVSVRADADLGAGMTEIVGTADVEVVAGSAVTAGISLGTPESQP